jgi:hypothetical protein
MFAAVFTSLLGNGLGLGYLGSHALYRWKNKEYNQTSIDYKNQPIYKYIALWIFISPLGWIALNKADFVTLTLLANTFMVLLIPALAGGLWWITASSRMIGSKYKNKWWENFLMAVLFVLAIWGTVKAVQSMIEMVSKLF